MPSPDQALPTDPPTDPPDDPSRRPLVLVHGNPETAAVWDPLVAALGREDVVRLSPPGFGSPLPDGFAASRTGYRDWLLAELEEQPVPADVIGHDWGGLHVLAAVARRPDLVHSWVTDAAGCFDADYVWHDLAQVWQTPDEGEAWVRDVFGASQQDRLDAVRALGISDPTAQGVAAGWGEQMGRAVLSLYRSAAQPAMAEAGRELATAASAPGLVLDPTEDELSGSPAGRRRVAAATGARVAVLGGSGHWWLVQDPVLATDVLNEFWQDIELRRKQ